MCVGLCATCSHRYTLLLLHAWHCAQSQSTAVQTYSSSCHAVHIKFMNSHVHTQSIRVNVKMINAHTCSLNLCETPCLHTQTTRRSLAVVCELLWQTLSTCTSPSAAPEDKRPGKWCSGPTLSQEQHLDRCVVCVYLCACACNCFMSD